jgi:uncharacterized protein
MNPVHCRCLAAAAAGLLAAALGACGSAPEVRLHSLLAGTTAAAPVSPQVGTGPLRLSVAPVTVPAALDQPQWLVRRPDDTLLALEQDRWASPLRDEFRAALREGLVTRWGAVDVGTPGPAGSPAAPSPWRLSVEVLRLELRPGREVVLEARWSLLPPPAGARTAECRHLSREPVTADGVLPLAQAQRQAMGRLVDDIGRQLRTMAAGAGPACLGAPVS